MQQLKSKIKGLLRLSGKIPLKPFCLPLSFDDLNSSDNTIVRSNIPQSAYEILVKLEFRSSKKPVEEFQQRHLNKTRQRRKIRSYSTMRKCVLNYRQLRSLKIENGFFFPKTISYCKDYSAFPFPEWTSVYTYSIIIFLVFD